MWLPRDNTLSRDEFKNKQNTRLTDRVGRGCGTYFVHGHVDLFHELFHPQTRIHAALVPARVIYLFR